MSQFIDNLNAAVKRNNSLLCVGIDPALGKMPPQFSAFEQPFFAFGKAIVDATHDLVCAYKPQIAYYASHSAESELEATVAYIKANYPYIPVILDSKRGDIGATAEQYAQEAFDRYSADAVTLNPYMGSDCAAPFLERADKGAIFLCRTSNSGAADFQELEIDGSKLYEHVASRIANDWNQHRNCCLVVGATAPEQIARVRRIVGDMPLLVPGVGAQGGDVEQIVKAGQTADGAGLIINASRSIIYASAGSDCAEAARQAALSLRDQINQYRAV